MRGKEWTTDHTGLMISLNELGCSDHVIAGATGHDVDTVTRRRRSLGLSPVYRSVYGSWRALPAETLRAIAQAA